MRKLFLLISLWLVNNICVAEGSYATSTGLLTVLNVSVDGSIAYDHITLRLNLVDGTFEVVNATASTNLFSNERLQRAILADGLTIDFYGCKLSNTNQVTCMEKYSYPDRSGIISIFGDPNSLAFYNQELGYTSPLLTSESEEMPATLLTDNLNRIYSPSTITARNQSDINLIHLNLAQGETVEVKYIFNDFNPEATSISRFQPMLLHNYPNNRTRANYGEISF